jgi:hypothetical protein
VHIIPKGLVKCPSQPCLGAATGAGAVAETVVGGV